MVQCTGINTVLYSQWIMNYEEKIIMMCYSPKQCLIVYAILVKSVVLFPNAEFIPVPEIYFQTEMGEIKISVYFVHSKFRLPAKDLVILLIIELYMTTCYREKTLSIFTSKSVSVSVTCISDGKTVDGALRMNLFQQKD